MSVVMQLDATIRELEGLKDRIVKTAQHALKEAADLAKREADATTLYEDRTGTLRRSTKATFIPARMSSAIENKTPYARYVEEGQKAHLIVARRARFLRFFWKKKRKWMEVEYVNHPGTHPRPFFEKAGERGGEFLHHRLQTAIATSVTRHNRVK